MAVVNMWLMRKALVNSAMDTPVSSRMSLAGRPENKRENLWSKAIRCLAMRFRSSSYVDSTLRWRIRLHTRPSYQPRLYVSCIDTFIPCPALGEWVWTASGTPLEGEPKKKKTKRGKGGWVKAQTARKTRTSLLKCSPTHSRIGYADHLFGGG